jgi:predicted negative regulator of RcsB-dependent stress response
MDMNVPAVSAMDVSSTQTLYLELWKLEISAANNAFIHGQQAKAFNHYEAALGLAKTGVEGLMVAQEVLNLLAEAERQIAALVVTRHNLADLHRQAGQLDEAISHLCGAHETLFQLFHHPHGDIRELAQRHLRVTYRELMTFTQRHGQQMRINQTLLLTQYVCECCRQKIEH